jgi:hypothetical protein
MSAPSAKRVHLSDGPLFTLVKKRCLDLGWKSDEFHAAWEDTVNALRYKSTLSTRNAAKLMTKDMMQVWREAVTFPKEYKEYCMGEFGEVHPFPFYLTPRGEALVEEREEMLEAHKQCHVVVKAMHSACNKAQPEIKRASQLIQKEFMENFGKTMKPPSERDGPAIIQAFKTLKGQAEQLLTMVQAASPQPPVQAATPQPPTKQVPEDFMIIPFEGKFYKLKVSQDIKKTFGKMVGCSPQNLVVVREEGTGDVHVYRRKVDEEEHDAAFEALLECHAELDDKRKSKQEQYEEDKFEALAERHMEAELDREEERLALVRAGFC